MRPKAQASRFLHHLGWTLVKTSHFDIDRPIDVVNVEVLDDQDFHESVAMARPHTVLDLARMANLWTLSRLTLDGSIIEVGSYRGGGALHLANANPNRTVYACDSFQGFRHITPGLDDTFDSTMFRDTDEAHVRSLLASRDAVVVPGFFPASMEGIDFGRPTFVHLDVDTYDATAASLNFLAEHMGPGSLIVADDFQRRAGGVDRAVAEFVGTHGWRAIPIFPSQGLLLPP